MPLFHYRFIDISRCISDVFNLNMFYRTEQTGGCLLNILASFSWCQISCLRLNGILWRNLLKIVGKVPSTLDHCWSFSAKVCKIQEKSRDVLTLLMVWSFQWMWFPMLWCCQFLRLQTVLNLNQSFFTVWVLTLTILIPSQFFSHWVMTLSVLKHRSQSIWSGQPSDSVVSTWLTDHKWLFFQVDLLYPIYCWRCWKKGWLILLLQ